MSSSTGHSALSSTNWSLIRAARGGDSPSARQAMEELCKTYLPPINAYISSLGYPPDRAEDLTQGFFADLLKRSFLKSITLEEGSFRAFLHVACKNYLANERDRDCAQKRGGGRVVLSIHRAEAEGGGYLCEPSHEETAERLFVRRWAVTLLDQVLSRLEAEMRRKGKEALFDALKPSILKNGEGFPYAHVAADLHMTEGAVNQWAYRLRDRYRALFREEVGRTVEGDEGIDDEIRDLFAALCE